MSGPQGTILLAALLMLDHQGRDRPVAIWAISRLMWLVLMLAMWVQP